MAQRVLCIEGDESTRARLRSLLESGGFVVDETGTGLEGIARALALPPDLVLADVHLPDIEGCDLAARLKGEKILERVPVVAVGHSREEHDAALAAGADGFVEREANGGLADEVRAFLGGRRERLPAEGERERFRALAGEMAARLESAVAGERRASAKVTELERLRSVFMRNLAHELSTPLTPLAGYLKLLQGGKLGPLSPPQQRVLDSMVQSVTRLTRVVDNLSDFASHGAGESHVIEREVDPDRLADDVVEELRPQLTESRLDVAVAHAGGGPVIADPRKLRRAVANVVSNAVKFSPHGGVVLVEVSRAAGSLRFTVYDQGPGILASDAQLVFEPLHHAAVRGGEDARPPGSGLGLPAARSIAEAHGGRIWVESPPRTQPAAAARVFTGSKFVLEIPVRPRRADARGPGGSEPPG